MMASRQGASTTLSCKRCKSNVVNGLKCKKCENSFHVSCARLCNSVNFISSSEIICCDSVTTASAANDNDNAFFDAMEELTGENKKVDIHIFTYVIRQKDVVIHELREKVEILNNHIQLLQNFNLTNQKQFGVNAEKTDNITNDKDPKSAADKRGNKNLQINKQANPTINSNQDNNKNSGITRNNVAMGIMQVETKNKLHRYINLAKDTSQPSSNNSVHIEENINLIEGNSLPSTSQSNKSHNDVWKEIIHKKRRRQVVVGNNKNSNNVKGVPKSAVLHVCRLNKDTSADELTTHLKDQLPEVKCEPVISKHPEVYSSFRVTILEENFKRAMNPELWPYGACVSRFLDYRRRKIEPVT